MRVQVDDVLSSPKAVNGGAPQGSCVGVQIYAVGTGCIEAGLPDLEILFHESVREDPDWSRVHHLPRALEEMNEASESEQAGSPQMLQ